MNSVSRDIRQGGGAVPVLPAQAPGFPTLTLPRPRNRRDSRAVRQPTYRSCPSAVSRPATLGRLYQAKAPGGLRDS